MERKGKKRKGEGKEIGLSAYNSLCESQQHYIHDIIFCQSVSLTRFEQVFFGLPPKDIIEITTKGTIIVVIRFHTRFSYKTIL